MKRWARRLRDNGSDEQGEYEKRGDDIKSGKVWLLHGVSHMETYYWLTWTARYESG